MSVLRTSGGTRLTAENLPPATGWREFERAKKAYAGRIEELSAALRRLDRLRGLQANLLEPLKELEQLESACRAAEKELERVVDEHQAAWVADTEAKIEQARTDYDRALDALALSRAELYRLMALWRFVSAFPYEPYRPQLPPVQALSSQQGEIIGWERVIGALRADARPPEPRPRAVLHGRGAPIAGI